jgi:hypothetical protein
MHTGNRHREHAENQPADRSTPPIGAPPFVGTSIAPMPPIAMPAFVVPKSQNILHLHLGNEKARC